MIEQEKIESRSLDPITSLRDKLITIEAWLFTQQRIWLYGSGAIIAYAISLVARLYWHTWIFHLDGKPSCIDFSHFWVSGNLAGSADPALVYDASAFSAVRAGLAGADACISVMNHFVYPPTYLFFTYPLGSMPYVAAFAAWTVATVLLYLGAIYLIVPRPIAILAALSPFPVFFNFFLGQNGFLLAGLMGLSLVLMAVVSWVWAKPLPHSLKAAALCSAAPLATPFVHGHDLCVLAIAVAFLVKDGLARGFLPGDRSIMLFAWIVIFLGFRDFSSGWIPCLALLTLVVRRGRNVRASKFVTSIEPGSAVACPAVSTLTVPLPSR
jgi:hypothetical protein